MGFSILSSNVSTITSSYISILFGPILTVTSLNMSLLSRLQQDVFSITLLSIANLFVLEYNQGLLDFLSYLNYGVYCLNCSHIPFFSPISQISDFYSFLPNVQTSHNYSNFFLCLHLLHKDFFLFLLLSPCPYRGFLTTTVFILSIPSIGVGLAGTCCISCLFSHTWGGGI